MAFIDELKLHIKAGNGGDGVVRWLHEKGKEFMGPAGGNGGRGADVYARAIRDIGVLKNYQNIKEISAPKGVDGGNKSCHGADGEDLYIDLPVGSIVTNLQTGGKVFLNIEGESKLLAVGGRGGQGNETFKSSTNQRPEKCSPGKPGEEFDFYIEVELVADAGLIGLPNAGKSSLINELTNAKSKVGAYQFTTLEPALGNMYGYILADLPGLIEGASEGKGLGHKFLRHIKRTKILFHCVSLESENIIKDYKTIRKELKDYSPELALKKEVVILTKTDMVPQKTLNSVLKKISKLNPDILTVTILDDESIKALKDNLIKILREVETELVVKN
jgi:GTP-binding protein